MYPFLLIVCGAVVTLLDVCLKQDTRLREIVEHHGARTWRMVAEQLGTPRSDVQCLHRWAFLSYHTGTAVKISGLTARHDTTRLHNQVVLDTVGRHAGVVRRTLPIDVNYWVLQYAYSI